VSGSNDEHIRIYDLQKRKELGTLLAHQGSITALKFSRGENKSSNKWLLSASDDHKIIIWRVKDWENFGTLKGHIGRINDIAIHPSNRIAVSVSDDHSIRLWNLMTVKKAAVLKLRNYNQNGQFVRWLGAEGQHFAVALMTKVLVYSTEDAKVCHEIDLKRKTLMHMETVHLGDVEYICVGLNDGSIEFYDSKKLLAETELVSTLAPEFSLLGHTNRVKDFNFYTNVHGTYLVSIGSDGKVVVWGVSPEKQEQLAVYDCGERLNCLALCDESIEKYDTMRKRDSDKADMDEIQSEVESDTEELKKAMFGKKKRSKKQKKAKKISVELE